MKRLFLLAALALLPVAAFADEGMWMIHALNQALEKKMQERGLQLSAGEIYNADAPGTTVSDAVVSSSSRTITAPTATCSTCPPRRKTTWRTVTGRFTARTRFRCKGRKCTS